jgi:predicted  nucleic acid-binding Zn-ribbon protein
MISAPLDTVLFGSAGTVVLSLLLNYLWKVSTKNYTETHRATAEVDFIKTLREENKLLRERVDIAEKERSAAIDELHGLRWEVKHLREQVHVLNEDLKDYRKRIGETMRPSTDQEPLT